MGQVLERDAAAVRMWTLCCLESAVTEILYLESRCNYVIKTHRSLGQDQTPNAALCCLWIYVHSDPRREELNPAGHEDPGVLFRVCPEERAGIEPLLESLMIQLLH